MPPPYQILLFLQVVVQCNNHGLWESWKKGKKMWYVICNMTYHFIEWHFISLKCNQTTKILLNSKSTFKVSLKKKNYQCYRSQEKRWCLTSMSRTPSRRGLWSWLGGGGSSQSGFRVKGNCASTRSSHLICTQPGDFRKDHGWYHLSTTSALEQRTSSQRCNTCRKEYINNNN